MTDLSKSLLEILFLLSDDIAMTNTKIARALRRYNPAISRDLTILIADELIEQNSELEYLITQKGLDLLQKPEYKTAYYQEIKEFVKQLKKQPEPKGWIPVQLDMGGLTHAQADMLYMFEENDNLTNAKIARILRRQYSSTYKDLQNLTYKGLLVQNSDKEYSLTTLGHDLIQRNVSRNTRCGITRNFVLQLKKRPERRGLWTIIVGAFASLGLIKTKSAYAATTHASTEPITPIGTSISSMVVYTTPTTSVISSKVLASIIGVILVTSVTTGVYIIEPEAFANPIPTLLTIDKSNIGFNGNTHNTSFSSSGNVEESGSNSHNNSGHGSPGSTSDSNSVNGNKDLEDTSDVFSEEKQEPISQNISISDSSTGSGSEPKINSDVGYTSLNQERLGREIVDIDYSFNEIIGIKIDHQDNLYVIDSPIMMFTPDGPAKEISSASDIVIDPKGNVYATDIKNNSIKNIDSNTNVKREIILKESKIQPFSSYADVAIDSPGNIYVVDNDIIQKFDSEGIWRTDLDLIHPTLEDSIRPYGIAIDTHDFVYVTDGNNFTIQKFDPNGILVDSIGSRDEFWMFPPIEIAIDNLNNLYVTDIGSIKKYDEKGNPQPLDINNMNNTIGTIFNTTQSESIKFENIVGIATDFKGNIYVADAGSTPVTRISFEDALVSIIRILDPIKCDTDSMINNPIAIPTEISTRLVSELLLTANDFSTTEQFDESLLYYYIVSQMQFDNVNAWNGIGYAQTQICLNDSAEIAYAQSLSIDPDNINAKIGLVDFTIDRVDREDNAFILKLENAELQLQSVLDLDSRNTNAFNALGYIETLRENYSKSIDYYQDSLKIDSQKTTTLNGMAYAQYKNQNLGSKNNCVNDKDENDKGSICYYEEVVKQDKNNFDALSGLILIYSQQDKDTSEYERQLEQYNDIVADILIKEGNWLQQNGQIEEGQRLLDKAKKLQQN